MKIGMNMHLWSTLMTEAYYPAIERLKSIGYDGIEVYLAGTDPGVYRQLGSFTQSLGIEVNGALGLGPDHNAASPDAGVRQAALDAMKNGIDNLVSAGGKNMCGPFHSAVGTFTGLGPQTDELKHSADVMREAAEYAAQADVTLTPEALNRFECYLVNTMQQLVDLVNLVDHPSLLGMFDTHHATIEERSYEEAIRTIEPILGLVHISESHRGTAGTGAVRWDEVFATLKAIDYDGWFTVEAFGRNDPEFAKAVHVWRDFDDVWTICEQSYALVTKYLAAP